MCVATHCSYDIFNNKSVAQVSRHFKGAFAFGAPDLVTFNIHGDGMVWRREALAADSWQTPQKIDGGRLSRPRPVGPGRLAFKKPNRRPAVSARCNDLLFEPAIGRVGLVGAVEHQLNVAELLKKADSLALEPMGDEEPEPTDGFNRAVYKLPDD